MNPTIKNGKEILNSKIKKREFWRPYAPSIIKDDCEEWFECNSSDYMLRAVKVKKPHLIPCVSHVDGTSRIQTVSHVSNPLFYKLLNEFKKKTGIPMLLNTSLNVGGQPIFSCKKQCVQMIENTEIDAICFGNSIITKNGIS